MFILCLTTLILFLITFKICVHLHLCPFILISSSHLALHSLILTSSYIHQFSCLQLILTNPVPSHESLKKKSKIIIVQPMVMLLPSVFSNGWSLTCILLPGCRLSILCANNPSDNCKQRTHQLSCRLYIMIIFHYTEVNLMDPWRGFPHIYIYWRGSEVSETLSVVIKNWGYF